MDIDEKARSVIEPELHTDEKLLWAGRPYRGLAFGAHDIFFIPFSLLWAGFALPFGGFMMLSGGLTVATLGGTLFFFLGLYFLLGRFIVDIVDRMNTFYGITNDRVLIRRGVLRKSIRSLPLKSLQDVSLTERLDGIGTIRFGQPDGAFSIQYRMFGGAGSSSVPTFFRIESAIEILGLLYLALGRARGTA